MAEPSLGRTIGFRTTISLLIGTVIGSGIFMRPAEIASLLGSPALLVLAWILGGLVTMVFTMILAEVAAMIPEDGGTYSFMRHMYGDFWSYLYGWANFAVINCAGTAGIAFIFSEYLGYFIRMPRFDAAMEKSIEVSIPMLGTVYPLEHIGVKLCTILILVILSLVNYRSTKAGGTLQVVSTLAKIIAIACLSFGLFVSGKGEWGHFLHSSTLVHPTGFALILAMAAAINGTLQAYDGATTMLNMTGEIKDPQKNIPRSLFWGLWICIGVYLLVNLGMIYMLDIDTMAGSSLVAADAATGALGPLGTALVTALICLSVFGTTNSNVLTPPRLTFAMARQQHMFRFAGKIHPRFNTPGNAILLHLGLMIVMVFSGSFYMLTDMYIFILWFFNLFLIAGLFILRRKMPDAVRPYKVWGYPWMPAIIFLGNLIYLGLIIYGDAQKFIAGKSVTMNSVAGMAITALGIPLYFYLKRKQKPHESGA